jgi:hypothetical protein
VGNHSHEAYSKDSKAGQMFHLYRIHHYFFLSSNFSNA